MQWLSVISSLYPALATDNEALALLVLNLPEVPAGTLTDITLDCLLTQLLVGLLDCLGSLLLDYDIAD